MYTAALAILLAGAGSVSAALEVDLNSKASIKSAAKDVAFDVMSYYKGNQSGETAGVFGAPSSSLKYQWWNGAVLWSTMLDYWRYTGDETYNKIATEGIVFQIDSRTYPFLSANWTAGMSTDGQGFWGLTAMSAAELEFPNPAEGSVTWIELAQGVFQALEARYIAETDVCGGGLRAQIPLINDGYELKNTLSNGVFLNLGARLARYTGNQTYAEWADRTWDWLVGVGLIGDPPNIKLIADSISAANCSDVNDDNRWTASTGVILEAAAYMYNQTTGPAQTLWRDRVANITHLHLSSAFPFTHADERILVEYDCETGREAQQLQLCGEPGGDERRRYYKGVYLRQLASTAQLAPFVAGEVARRFRDSAAAAVKTCDGGETGRACGYVWNFDANWERKRAVQVRRVGDDDEEGGDEAAGAVGGPPEEMNALSVLLGLLVDEPARRGFATIETAGRGEEGNGGDGGSGDGDGSEGSGGGSGNGNSDGGSGGGSGSGNGNGGSGGNGGESQGNGDGGSAATTTHVAVGWMAVGLVAALF